MPAPSPPTAVYPICTQLLQIGLESGGFGVAPAQTAYASVPIANFMPDNKIMPWIEDTSMWGDFVKTHDLQEGPRWAESEIKESPLYGDTFGHFLYNLLGDLVETGTASTPTWTTSGALSAGAGPIPVTSGSTAVAGTYIQVDTGVNAEVVKVGTGSSATSIVLDATTPLRFSHLTTIAVVTVIAPFSHVFSLLNPYGSTGVVTGQGPTHSLIHRTGIPGSGNNYSWLFSYGCMSEITITGKATGALMWSGKVTTYIKTYPSFTPTPSFSAVRMIPAWNSTTTVASSAVNDITEWSVTMTRDLDVIPTADGYQQPYLIGRGNLSAPFKLMYSPALDESPLTAMLSNSQPTLAWSISNGLSGSSLVSFALAANQAAYKETPLESGKTFWGWNASGEFIANTVNSGNSGGKSPLSITLQNAIPTYA
jgi:hypothetical protein